MVNWVALNLVLITTMRRTTSETYFNKYRTPKREPLYYIGLLGELHWRIQSHEMGKDSLLPMHMWRGDFVFQLKWAVAPCPILAVEETHADVIYGGKTADVCEWDFSNVGANNELLHTSTDNPDPAPDHENVSYHNIPVNHQSNLLLGHLFLCKKK